MSTYSINLETASWNATVGIMDLDKTFVGTADYMGVAYFWSHEFKHWLRSCTVVERRRVHSAWLRNGLSFDAGIDPTIDSAPHWEIVKRVCKSIRRDMES